MVENKRDCAPIDLKLNAILRLRLRRLHLFSTCQFGKESEEGLACPTLTHLHLESAAEDRDGAAIDADRLLRTLLRIAPNLTQLRFGLESGNPLRLIHFAFEEMDVQRIRELGLKLNGNDPIRSGTALLQWMRNLMATPNCRLESLSLAHPSFPSPDMSGLLSRFRQDHEGIAAFAVPSLPRLHHWPYVNLAVD